jgi:hypothetical protein
MKLYYCIVCLFCIFLTGCGYEIGYNSYDECMLVEMEGHQALMIGNANKVCENKFPYEKDISYLPNEIDSLYEITSFQYEGEDKLNLSVTYNNSDYRFTKAVAKFKPGDCKGAHWPKEYEAFFFQFRPDGKQASTSRKTQFSGFVCLEIISLHGILKK